MKKQVLTAVLGLVVIMSCTKSNDSNSNNQPTSATTCTGAKSYSSDVSPIIQTICANSGCHDASSTNGVGPLTNYQQVFNSRTTIRSAVASGVMPKNTTLTADQKNAILCWIDSGASNN